MIKTRNGIQYCIFPGHIRSELIFYGRRMIPNVSTEFQCKIALLVNENRDIRLIYQSTLSGRNIQNLCCKGQLERLY